MSLAQGVQQKPRNRDLWGQSVNRSCQPASKGHYSLWQQRAVLGHSFITRCRHVSRYGPC